MRKMSHLNCFDKASGSLHLLRNLHRYYIPHKYSRPNKNKKIENVRATDVFIVAIEALDNVLSARKTMLHGYKEIYVCGKPNAALFSLQIAHR